MCSSSIKVTGQYELTGEHLHWRWIHSVNSTHWVPLKVNSPLNSSTKHGWPLNSHVRTSELGMPKRNLLQAVNEENRNWNRQKSEYQKFFFYFKKESLFIRFVQFEKWLVINNKQIIYNFKFLKIGILKTARHWLQNEEANTFTLVENDDGVRSEHAGCWLLTELPHGCSQLRDSLDSLKFSFLNFLNSVRNSILTFFNSRESTLYSVQILHCYRIVQMIAWPIGTWIPSSPGLIHCVWRMSTGYDDDWIVSIEWHLLNDNHRMVSTDWSPLKW